MGRIRDDITLWDVEKPKEWGGGGSVEIPVSIYWFLQRFLAARKKGEQAEIERERVESSIDFAKQYFPIEMCL